MIVDLHRDVRRPCRWLAVEPGEWPHELVPAGLRDVQLLDYMLVERGVELDGAGRRVDGRVAREVALNGYSFFVELEAVAAPDPQPDAARPAAPPAAQAEALLRRARMLLAAAQACRAQVAELDQPWPDDLQNLAAALKLERMTQGLVDQAADFPLDADWLGLPAAG